MHNKFFYYLDLLLFAFEFNSMNKKFHKYITQLNIKLPYKQSFIYVF